MPCLRVVLPTQAEMFNPNNSGYIILQIEEACLLGYGLFLLARFLYTSLRPSFESLVAEYSKKTV